MISVAVILLISLFYTIVSWPLTYMLGKISKIERLGIAFLLGSGLSTFLWFILYQLGFQFNLLSLGFSGLIIWLASFLINKLGRFKYQDLVERKVQGFNLWLSYLVCTLLLISFIIGSYNPISGWDAVTLYDFRGHTIALNHSLKDLTDGSYYISYPLMISLMHASVYLLKGISAQGIHSVIFMALLAVVYGRLRQWTNPRLSLIAILAIILNEEMFAHSIVSYVNLPHTVYLITGLLYAVTPGGKRQDLGYLFLAGLLTGLTTWIRSDVPFWLLGIFIILIQGVRLKAKVVSLVSVYVVYLIRHTWLKFFYGVLNALKLRYDRLDNPITVNALKQASSNLPNPETIRQISHNLPEITGYLYQHIFSPYRGLWLLAIPITLIAMKKKDPRLALLLLVILMSAAMVTAGVMLFSATYVTWEQIGGSARRMMLFIIPLSIITSIYALHLITTGKNNEK